MGKPEHVTVSVPVVDRDLPESVLRVKSRKALFDRGVTGGCMIFHGFREDKKRHVLVWSPHYHALVFIGFIIIFLLVKETVFNYTKEQNVIMDHQIFIS